MYQKIIDLNLVPLINDEQTYRLGAYFFGGSILAILKVENFPKQKLIIGISILLYIVTILTGIAKIGGFLLLPIIVILFGLQKTKIIKDVGKRLGDISYGVYIYGWLIQQTLLYYFPFKTTELTIFALIITYILGYTSWHLVEKKALQFK